MSEECSTLQVTLKLRTEGLHSKCFIGLNNSVYFEPSSGKQTNKTKKNSSIYPFIHIPDIDGSILCNFEAKFGSRIGEFEKQWSRAE